MLRLALAGTCYFALTACSASSSPAEPEPKDPELAELVPVDRFSAEAATMMRRDESNGLPQPNAPIDFDAPPFITRGLGPAGESSRYYNFDVQDRNPGKIFLFFVAGAADPLPRQLPIIDSLPGESAYSDFREIHRVSVPASYVPNTLTDVEALQSSGFAVQSTGLLVNAPVVPKGSTARLRVDGREAATVRAWYEGRIAYFFEFETGFAASIDTLGQPLVPLAYIWVAFNINPDEAGGGPASGAMTEPGTDQTHNVVSALPGMEGYSPLWNVIPYDNDSFASVVDRQSAEAAPVVPGAATPYVNCPVVSID
jgi:hypothetical protein